MCQAVGLAYVVSWRCNRVFSRVVVMVMRWIGGGFLVLVVALCVGCKSGQHSEQGVSTSAARDTAPAEPPTTTPLESETRDEASKAREQPPLAAKIIEEPGDASDFYYTVVDARGEEVNLPEQVRERVYNALYPALALKGRAVIYDHGEALYAHVFGSAEEQQILALLPDATTLDYHWVSPSGARVAVIQKTDEGKPRLDVIALDQDGLGKALLQKELAPVPLIPCGSRCSVAQAGFEDEHTFRYLVRGGEQDPADPDSPLVFERVVLP